MIVWSVLMEKKEKGGRRRRRRSRRKMVEEKDNTSFTDKLPVFFFKKKSWYYFEICNVHKWGQMSSEIHQLLRCKAILELTIFLVWYFRNPTWSSPETFVHTVQRTGTSFSWNPQLQCILLLAFNITFVSTVQSKGFRVGGYILQLAVMFSYCKSARINQK